MPDVAFTNYAFPATGTTINRTMPVRLNDIINVKDFGAKGDSITDDTAAIQGAINYVYALHPEPVGGAIVFVPRGTYIIGSPPLILSNSADSHHGALRFVGAGRGATVLKGTSTGFVTVMQEAADSLACIVSMKIWNQSTAANSGAFNLVFTTNAFQMRDCHLVGMRGFESNTSEFGISIYDSIMECSAPIAEANSATPGPVSGTTGVRFEQGEMVNCSITGFDVGVKLGGDGGGFGALVNGCKISQCNVGMTLGSFIFATTLLSNQIDRCSQGILINNANGSLVASNVISGTSGPAGFAPIQSMSWHSGTHVVTVTTAAAHNLASGSQDLILSVSPSTWVLTSDNKVTITRTSSTQFTYAGPSSDPGAFSSGTWNYPCSSTIRTFQSTDGAYLANVMTAVTSSRSFDMRNGGGSTQWNNTCASMRGPYGWYPPDYHPTVASANFINCGVAGANPPVAFMTFAQLPGESGVFFTPRQEGQEYTITDAATQGSFAGTVTSGGSNHYKIRYNGTNWIRVG
jgi:hypothetical protein